MFSVHRIIDGKARGLSYKVEIWRIGKCCCGIFWKGPHREAVKPSVIWWLVSRPRSVVDAGCGSGKGQPRRRNVGTPSTIYGYCKTPDVLHLRSSDERMAMGGEVVGCRREGGPTIICTQGFGFACMRRRMQTTRRHRTMCTMLSFRRPMFHLICLFILAKLCRTSRKNWKSTAKSSPVSTCWSTGAGLVRAPEQPQACWLI